MQGDEVHFAATDSYTNPNVHKENSNVPKKSVFLLMTATPGTPPRLAKNKTGGIPHQQPKQSTLGEPPQQPEQSTLGEPPQLHFHEAQLPLDQLRRRWTDRAQVFRDGHGGKYQRTQARFLPLSLVPKRKRYQAMKKLQQLNGWKGSTTATYWDAFLAAQKVLGEPRTAEDTMATKLFKRQSRLEKVEFPEPATRDEIWMAAEMAPQPLKLAMKLSWLLAQRVGDILQLRADDIDEWGLYVTVTFHRGKVVPIIQPYTLHLHQTNPVAMELLKVARAGHRTQFLFTGQNSETQRRAAGDRVKRLLQAVNPRLELRSIRRGALQCLATVLPLAEVLHFSKHASTQMLERYLGWGKVSGMIAHTTAIAADRILLQATKARAIGLFHSM